MLEGRILLVQALLDTSKLRLGLGQSDSGGEAPNDGSPVPGARPLPRIGVDDDRHEELRLGLEQSLGRKHTDHGVGNLVEGQRPADDLLVCAKPCPPVLVGQDQDPRVTGGGVLAGREAAAEPGCHPESQEVVHRDPQAGDPLGLVHPGEDTAHRLGDPQVAKARAVVAPVLEGPAGHRVAASVANGLEDADDLGRLGIRQRLDQHGVDDAVDRSGGADPQGQGEYGHGGRESVSRDLTEGEAQVAEHGDTSGSGSLPVGTQSRRPDSISEEAIPVPDFRSCHGPRFAVVSSEPVRL